MTEQCVAALLLVIVLLGLGAVLAYGLPMFDGPEPIRSVKVSDTASAPTS